MKKKQGHETAVLPAGFRASGVCVGIKKTQVPDMALLVSDRPAAVAGVFTTNQVQAAPVRLDRDRLQGGVARAIVVNSGNANACNGRTGMRDARRMAALVAGALRVPEASVFVCSTGTIGRPLPMPVIAAGIPCLISELSPEGGEAAARAIMTTDTRPKRVTTSFRVDGTPVRLTGLCKGSGMIEPNMATMLCFLVTDANVQRRALQQALRKAVDRSFNRITVDGDRSTNDTVLLMANGAAGHAALRPGQPGWARFVRALEETTEALAHMIVRDGEGATRFVTIRVRGARSARDADRAARAVANSLLVKTAWAGANANWGRVMDALGYSAAKVVEEKVDVRFDRLQTVRGGRAAKATPEQLRAVIARPEFTVDIHLHLGGGEAVIYTCNCTEEYVRINR